MPIGSGTALGWNALLGFGQETTWGTRATGTSFMEFRSESFSIDIEEDKLNSIGTGRAIARRVQKQTVVGGSLAYDLHPVDGIPLIKHALMGTVTSADVTQGAGTITNARVHTFTTGDMSGISQKGLTFDVRMGQNTSTAFAFMGMRVNSFKLTGAINEPISAEIEFIGRSGSTVAFATTTAAYSNVTPYMFDHGSFAYSSTSATENIIGFELTINNNLHADTESRSMGNRVLTALPPGPREITLNITQRFDTTTAYDRFIAASSAAIFLSFDTGVTIGSVSGATTYSMQIHFPKAYYNKAVPEISDSGIITHNVNISAISDTLTNAGSEIYITVYNSTTSYV